MNELAGAAFRAARQLTAIAALILAIFGRLTFPGLALGATWCVLTSGTVKEASMLAITLNLAGFACVACSAQLRALKRRIHRG